MRFQRRQQKPPPLRLLVCMSTFSANVKSFLLSLVLLLLVAQQPVHGLITIMNTGEQFATKPDAHYGPLLRKGFEYEAHLQYINQEGGRFVDLCPDPNYNDKNFNISIVVPPFPDLYGRNVPVALLAQTGRCSLAEKLQFIQQHVQPANVVQFLIVERRSMSSWMDQDDENDDYDYNDDDGYGPSKTQKTRDNIMLIQDELLYPSLRQHHQNNNDEENYLQRQHRDESIPISVLHVTPRTLSNLWNVVNQQSANTKLEGGPRIQLDARLGNHGAASSIWVALCALTSACCCSFLLACGQRGGWFDPDELDNNNNNNNNNAPNTRQPRRRLTREQVKRIFPIYRFNGECLEAIPDATTTTASTSTRQVNELTQGPLSHDDVESAPLPPRPVELADCSICLDDYQVGDRIRCLDPCNHAFHAKCIGKWLAERSATCPLCKTDMWDPQEEEDDSDEDDGIVAQEPGTDNNNNDPGTQYFFGSQLASWVTLGNNNRTFAEDPGTAAATVTPQGNGSDTTTADAATTTPWWRRIFSSSRPAPALQDGVGGDSSDSAAAVVEMLTEPLLVTQDQQETGQQESPHQAAHRPDPAAATLAAEQQQQQPATAPATGATAENANTAAAAAAAAAAVVENNQAVSDTTATTTTSMPDPPGTHSSRQVSV